MRPNFKDIDIKNAGFAANNAAEWAKSQWHRSQLENTGAHRSEAGIYKR